MTAPSSRLPAVPPRHTRGIALISVLLLLAVLLMIIMLYSSLALRETLTSNLSGESLRGFYAAEGGLNRRAADISHVLATYNLPSGTGPTTATPCAGADVGSGDLACQTLSAFTGRKVVTYGQNLTKDQVNGDFGSVEAGSPFAGLNFLQFDYKFYSKAIGTTPTTGNQVQAKTQVEFQSRLIPIFQFAGFFENDLELGVGGIFTLNGRLHSNHDVYLGGDWPYGVPNPNMNVYSKFPTTVTAGGDLFAARHNSPGVPYQNRAAVNDKLWGAPTTSLTPMTAAEKAAVFPDARAFVPKLTVPSLTTLARSTSSDFWNYASLRVVAVVTAVPGVYTFVARKADGSVNAQSTAALAACRTVGNNGNDKLNGNGRRLSGYITTSSTLYDGREARYITTLNVNQNALMQCIYGGGFTKDDGSTLAIDDPNHGGLVIHMSFEDPAAAGPGYGVRLTNTQTLGDGRPGATQPVGVTFVSDQPLYLQGDFNSLNKIPAAVMGDAINLLSNSWNESKGPVTPLPMASATTVNAALLSGSDLTVPYVSDGGGMQNFLRLHENWGTPVTVLTYKGSIVSLGTTLHTRGAWCQGGSCYTAPKRNFDFDPALATVAGLPPLTPNITYVRQVLFSRQYQ